jgi:protein TonB
MLKAFATPGLDKPWYASLVQEIRDRIHPPQLPPLELTSKAVEIQEMEVLPWYVSLLRELRDRIRPPQLPPLELTSKAVEVQDLELLPWYISVFREIRDRIHPPELPPLELTSRAVEVEELQTLPWYASLFREIRDRICPPQLPSLELTSRAVEVQEFWGEYRFGKSSLPVSLAIHGIIVALLVGIQLAKMLMGDVPSLDIPSNAVLLMPPPPPPPGPPVAHPVATRIRVRPALHGLQFPVERELPEVAVVAEPPMPDSDVVVPGGVAGGMSGGVVGGMMGGVVGGVIGQMLNQIPVPAPPPPPKVAASLPEAPMRPPEPPPPTLQRIEVNSEVQQGKLLVAIPPRYPPLAQRSRIQGTVRLEAVIAKDGTLIEIKALEGHPLLIEAAIEAVRNWRYLPTVFNGNPVEVQTLIDVDFRLN